MPVKYSVHCSHKNVPYKMGMTTLGKSTPTTASHQPKALVVSKRYCVAVITNITVRRTVTPVAGKR
jgi:hypothetical protein